MKTKEVIWRIIKFFYKKMPAASVLSTLAYVLENFHATIMTVLSAYFFEEAYGYLAGSGNAQALWGCAALIIGYYLVYHIVYSLSSICINAGVYEKALHLLNDDLVETVSGISLIQFEDEETLKCRKRAEECVKNERIPGIFMLTTVLMTSIAGIFSLLVTLGLYHPLLPIVAAASVAQFFLSDWLLEKEGYRLEVALTQKRRKRDYIWSLFTDLASVREMRVMGFTGYLAERWKTERDAVNEKQWELDRKKSRYHLLCDAIMTFGYLTGVVLCVFLLRKNVISVGVFGACLVAFASVQKAVGNFFSSVGRLPGFVSLAAHYVTVIDKRSVQESKLPKLQERIEAIEVKNVDFRYPHSQKLSVRNASLTIRRGEVISLIGVNGSGKTTLVKLILGIYNPAQGEVLYNGIDLEGLDKSSIYQHTALLSQDFALYPLSLDENIALADLSHVDEKDRIQDALKRTHMDGVRERTTGEDGILGKEFGGLEFSGGQKQRLALSRVLFADRELIILDEPTSALDPLQENAILEEFLRLAAGRTTIIISHRVGLCRYVDKIAVMKGGTVIECGTHEELMAEKGEYALLYDTQSKWYLDSAASDDERNCNGKFFRSDNVGEVL